MESSEFYGTVYDVYSTGRAQNLIWQFAEDHPVDGRHVRMRGQEFLTFSSCSYLGLELDERMKEGVRRAVDRYGTQFSNSRGYISAGPYEGVEERLSELFGGPALVTATTTLGHASAIPVLINEKDAIILDHQVHASIQMATTLAKANGTRVEVIRHGDYDKLEEVLAQLLQTRRHVWFMIDGVYSMFGDLPDVERIRGLLDRHEQFHLYVDDAHGMSIAGRHGRGVHLERMGHHPRMVLATSLNKAFASGGGCFVFPNEDMRDRVRLCGGTNIFSGPLQPPMLGAIQASTAIHLSDEIYRLQGELKERITRMNSLLLERDLPLLAHNEAPIFFLKMGLMRMSSNMAARLQKEGIYITVAPYPAVPMKRTGLRLTVTRHHTDEDLVRLCDAVAHHLPLALEEEGITLAEIEANFGKVGQEHTLEGQRRKALSKFFEIAPTADHIARPAGPFRPAQGLELQHTTSIEAMDKAMWDELLGDRGSFSSGALAMLERTFRDDPRPENNWHWHYFVVRNGGRPVLATFFTEGLSKDDMLMREEVSRLVEQNRKDDPYFLTSRVLSMGSLLTEGNHLWLDREGPWQEALAWVLEEASRIQRDSGCGALILRDLPSDDAEMDGFLLNRGLVRVPMLDAFELPVDWKDDEAFLAGVSKRTRQLMRREVLDREPLWEVRVYGADARRATEADIDVFHGLYMNIKRRRSRLNVFDLPRSVFSAMATTPGWEITALHLAPEHGGPADGSPVAIVSGHAGKSTYTGLIAGLNYGYPEQNPYRQMLWQLIRRARVHGCVRLALGMDADFEKRRLGAVARPQCVYLQANDHFGGIMLDNLAQEVSLAASAERKAG